MTGERNCPLCPDAVADLAEHVRAAHLEVWEPDDCDVPAEVPR